MSMLKERLRDAFDYAQFTASLGVFSVNGVITLQKAMEHAGFPPLHNMTDNPMNIAMLAAGTGVSVGNSYLQDFAVRNCLPHAIYATMVGYFTGVATEHMAASSYITGFTAAAAGLALRRNLILYDATDEERNRQRDYDDFDY